MKDLSIYNLSKTVNAINTSNKGRFLIEANAGSGKTWQIATLYCWLIASNDEFLVDNIIVTTFTKAATFELKERIVLRLAEFQQTINNYRKTHDQVNKLGIPDEQWQILCQKSEDVYSRLTTACQRTEYLQINTIHGFILDLLWRFALPATLPIKIDIFEPEHEMQLWQDSVAYAWRRALFSDDLINYFSSLNNISPTTLQLFQQQQNFLKDGFYSTFSTIEKLSDRVWPLKQNINIKVDVPDNPPTNDYLKWFEICDEWRELLSSQKNDILDNISSKLDGRIYKDEQIKTYINSAIDFFASYGGIKEKTNASTNKTDKLFLTAINSKTSAATKKSGNFTPLSIYRELEETVETWRLTITALNNFIEYHQIVFAYNHASQYYKKQAEQLQRINFNQIIANAHQLLTTNSPLSKDIVNRFRAQNKALLIDEFQDTDAMQWGIYQNLQSSPDDNSNDEILLVVVGDPKQSIYNFRSADIYTYFSAQNTMNGTIVLDGNYRSQPNVVGAINLLFNDENPFINSNIKYSPSLSKKQFPKGEAHEIQPYKLLILDENLTTNGDRSEAAYADMISRIQAIRTHKPGASIAVLVNTNAQSDDITKVLGANKLAVISESAKYSPLPITSSFVYFLQAIAKTKKINDANINFINDELINLLSFARHDFANVLFSPLWSADSLPSNFLQIVAKKHISDLTKADKQILTNLKTRLLEWADIWDKHGILAIYKTLIHNNLESRVMNMKWDVRDLQTLQHLCLWLAGKTNNPVEQIILLKEVINERIAHSVVFAEDEIDKLSQKNNDNPIGVYTVFKAKGRQWDYVFCPVGWHQKSKKSKQYYKDGHWHINFHDSGNEEVKKLISQNFVEEEMRNFYVLLTRSIYGCYLYWQKVKNESMPTAKVVNNLITNITNNPENETWQIINVEINKDITADINHMDNDLENNLPIDKANQPDNINKIVLFDKERKKIFLPNKKIYSYTLLTKLFPKTIENTDTTNNTKVNNIDDETLITATVRDESNSDGNDKAINNTFAGKDFGVAVHSLISQVLEKPNLHTQNISQTINEVVHNNYLLSNHVDGQSDINDENSYSATLKSFIEQAICTPLPFNPQSQLIDYSNADIQSEWDFTFSWRKINLQKWQAVSDKLQIGEINLPDSGFIRGSLDAIVFDNTSEKFHIIDFKTNIIEPNSNNDNKNLEDLVYTNRYQLQAAIYGLALHRYLLAHLPNYNPQEHFGGVWFNFIRNAIENKQSYYCLTNSDICLTQLNEVFVL